MGNACSSGNVDQTKEQGATRRRQHRFASVVDSPHKEHLSKPASHGQAPTSPSSGKYTNSGAANPSENGSPATTLTPSTETKKEPSTTKVSLSVTLADTLTTPTPPAGSLRGGLRRPVQNTDAFIDIIEAEQNLSMSKLAGPMLESKSTIKVDSQTASTAGNWESLSSGAKGSPRLPRPLDSSASPKPGVIWQPLGSNQDIETAPLGEDCGDFSLSSKTVSLQ